MDGGILAFLWHSSELVKEKERPFELRGNLFLRFADHLSIPLSTPPPRGEMRHRHPRSTSVRKGPYLGHFGSIILSNAAVISRNANIS